MWLHCTDLFRVQWALDNRRSRCPFEVVVDNCNVTVVEIKDIARCSCSLAYWPSSSWHLLGLDMLSELLPLFTVLEGWPLNDELATWSLDRWLNDGRLFGRHERRCICPHHSLNLATVGWEFAWVSLILAVLGLWGDEFAAGAWDAPRWSCDYCAEITRVRWGAEHCHSNRLLILAISYGFQSEVSNIARLFLNNLVLIHFREVHHLLIRICLRLEWSWLELSGFGKVFGG